MPFSLNAFCARLHLRLGVFAWFVLAGWPAVGLAQSVGLTPGIATLPPIGLPLPPIGLPLPRIGGVLPAIGLTTPSTADPSTPVWGRQAEPDRKPRHDRAATTVVYVVPAYSVAPAYYGWGYQPFVASSVVPGSIVQGRAAYAPRQVPATGLLRLDVGPEPAAQVYVDGDFVGTLADLNGELELDSGSHRVEIRAPGYETLMVDVRITTGQSITYRGALKLRDLAAAPPATHPAPTPPPAPPPKAAPQTFYLVPGCYMGNVPPTNLPAHCDLSRLVTRTP
jgi:hypothetical protein